MTEAYRSVVDISFDVKAGLLIRQTHHWAADVFVVAIVLHLLRVFFTGAFRKPRELVYYVGVAMLMLALLEGFLGYSLVDDLLSGMGLAIALLGRAVGADRRREPRRCWSGAAPFPGGPAFRSRMYIAHVLLLPVAIATLLSLHLLLVVARHHTQFPGPKRDRAPRRGAADVPRLRAAHARARASRSRPCSSCSAASSRSTRSGCGARTGRERDERRAAGLVPRLADRGAAADARLRRR